MVATKAQTGFSAARYGALNLDGEQYLDDYKVTDPTFYLIIQESIVRV